MLVRSYKLHSYNLAWYDEYTSSLQLVIIIITVIPYILDYNDARSQGT